MLCHTLFFHNDGSIFNNSIVISSLMQAGCGPGSWVGERILRVRVSVRHNECKRVFLQIPSLLRGADMLEIDIVKAHINMDT